MRCVQKLLKLESGRLEYVGARGWRSIEAQVAGVRKTNKNGIAVERVDDGWKRRSKEMRRAAHV